MRGPTRDHTEIRRWAESRNAHPVQVGQYIHDGEPALLRFVFGNVPEGAQELHAISWETFFAQFDLLGLNLVYEERGPQYELVHLERKRPDGSQTGFSA